VTSPQSALAQRIRELRRRHFGPRGKARFAERLGLTLDQYEAFERGVIPPADVLVRICETTGEDLQWLLTGIAARGTVVIAEARGRHRAILTRLANLLERRSTTANAVDAFLDLLERSAEQPGEAAARHLAAPLQLIPVLDAADLPTTLPPENFPGSDARFELVPLGEPTPVGTPEPVALAEPAMEYSASALRHAELVHVRTATGQTCCCLRNPGIANCFSHPFGVRLTNDSMRPMFLPGDAAIVAVGCGPKVGRPALCRMADDPPARCRIWLGVDHSAVHLGRLVDGEMEHVARQRVLWSLEVLYRLAPAA